MTARGAVHVAITRGQNANCTFINAFVPAGSISLSKVTHGATGTVLFGIARRTGASGAVSSSTPRPSTEGVPGRCDSGFADRCD